jgi:hypothetical protein
MPGKTRIRITANGSTPVLVTLPSDCRRMSGNIPSIASNSTVVYAAIMREMAVAA